MGTATQKRNFLQEIRTEVKARPTAAVLYGVPGIGKTSMAANIPGVVFLTDPTEDGITTLKSFNRVPKSVAQLPPARSWEDALGMIDQLATGEHSYRALAIDAMGGFERLCHEHVCRRDYRGEWGDKGFGSYQKGFDNAVTDWKQFIIALDRLRDERGMSIIWLAHSRVKNFKNPEGPDFDRYKPDVHEKTWEVTHKWAEMILFLNYVTVVDKDGKAQGGQERVMFTVHHPAYDAKNRHGLPDTIDMGSTGAEAWKSLADALRAAGKDGE